MDPTPFAYVAEKDGSWYGVIVALPDRAEEIGEFMTEFAGFTIRTMQNRDEWLQYSSETPAFGSEL